ncbi:hypothetical protein E8E13_007213 [Curvularia kusanoi]|uniref:Uncharacterized protein n=1 Tax=Curvularia kusanoi TaxID=90978 RepID=A0A9P4WE14_CURKU|nr:hypothetical protein E8E13_007213 [Curvularia kusanoi]
MLVTWGIVPIQAGIFSTETIRLSSEAVFAQSTSYIPATEQSDKIDSRYVYSAHGIIWLNESLPSFMTRDYALAPFRPLESAETISHENQTWTSLTTLYSLDLNCEVPGLTIEDILVWDTKNNTHSLGQGSKWVSSNGCEFPGDYYGNVGNETIGPNPAGDNLEAHAVKEFGSIWIGQYATEFADFYLETFCPRTANRTFMAFFTKHKTKDEDPPNEVTRLYCTPAYYEQKVNATVNARTRAPISYTAVGDRQDLSLDKWNSSYFERQMNSGQVNLFNRERALPLYTWPDQLETLSNYPISLANEGSVIQPMAGYAIGAYQGPMEGLLDPHVLAEAYQAAYRIVFARAMLEVLDQGYVTTSNNSGRYDYVVTAIVVVPVFTYIVEALLGLVSSQKTKPVRPKEFRLFAVLPFVLLNVTIAITLGVLLRQSQPFGIVRPSNSPIVRQIVENYVPTALATLVEPIWILINRLLCMLQPLDELRGGHAIASRSIDADYSSLPPQLVIFKALQASHFKLATVCAMALLANFLAVAFSGMFEERPILVPRKLQLSPPYQAKFVAINGTVTADMSLGVRRTSKASGAYRAGDGTNQFMVAESNYTSGNPLPAWTDNEFMYIPFMKDTGYNGSEAIQARTTAFGSTLDCSVIPDISYNAVLTLVPPHSLYANVNITMLDVTTSQNVTCTDSIQITRGPAPLLGIQPQCDDGKLSVEFVMKMDSLNNATQAERDFCQQTAFLAYARGENRMCVPIKNTTRLNDSNAVFIGCRPKFVAGEANVRVKANGQVEAVSGLDVSSSLSAEFYEQHFVNGSEAGGVSDLIAQAHGYLFKSFGGQFHNDSFAADMLNYFMVKQSNNSQLLNPAAPLPSLQEITEKLYPVYRKLFAIWLGINKDKLLLPHTESSKTVVEGQTNSIQTRIFLSRPLFIMAEIILGIYVIAAICVYLWRPGKFLPRMPTSIAAVITLFAASEAVEDMRGTASFTRRQRRQHLERLGATYGYGTFVGADGLPYEGIEKEPLVTAVPLPGVVEKIQMGFSQKSLLRGGD